MLPTLVGETPLEITAKPLQANLNSLEAEGVHQFGGDFFFCPSNVIQKSLIQEIGLALVEILLVPWLPC